jgi:serine protein kinase
MDGPDFDELAQKERDAVREAAGVLDGMATKGQQTFAALQQILSFDEYFKETLRAPHLHVRNAATYVRDTFDHYGSETVRTVRGPLRRFKLFDAAFNGGATQVFGQEDVQNEVYKHLTSFVERGRVDKLIMIHGPNGTAKSTFIECIMSGLEDYSHRPEGVLYRFNWIFSEAADRVALGFHERPRGRPDGSLAYLEPDEITFKLGCDLKDHPLLLLPAEDRLATLEPAFARAGKPLQIPDALLRGDLCTKCKEIQRALQNAYQGDLRRVLQHVQVERLYVSARYRRSAVVIQPQRNVDAASRPLNLEKSYRLPPILSQSALAELSGDLIDANRGAVEYSDFFKRPVELSKYLLTTSEKGTISLPDATAYLDCVFFASANEKNLSLFKRNPDFPSFKGRFELVRAPYLLRWSTEERIYKRQIHAIAQKKHVAPHSTKVIALWSVLTRLARPRSKHYKGELAGLVSRLRPLEKAHLYETGRAPEEWPEQERRELQKNVEQLAAEFDTAEEEFEGILDACYEGRRGASPREVLSMLAEAAQDALFPCLSPLAILKVIRRVMGDKSLYEFLRLEAEAGYGDVERLTDDVEGEYRRIVRDEVHRSLALVEESAYEQLFEDYFQHVKAFDAGEKLRNKHTNAMEQPSQDVMSKVETLVGITEKPTTFRKNLIVRIAAWVIDNPGKKVDYKTIFSDIFQALRQRYHRERETAISALQTQILRFGTEDWSLVNRQDQQRVLDSLERLKASGYCSACAKEALVYVLKHRGEE